MTFDADESDSNNLVFYSGDQNTKQYKSMRQYYRITLKGEISEIVLYKLFFGQEYDKTGWRYLESPIVRHLFRVDDF